MVLKKIENIFFNRSFIKLKIIEKNVESISYSIDISDDLNVYFKGFTHKIEIEKNDEEYNLKDIPDGIAIIPVLTNVLPLAWFFNSKLIIDELDETFYNSLKNIKSGYQELFPNIDFKGKIKVNNIVNYTYVPNNENLILFSNGLDSLFTLTQNINQNNHLFTLNGSDISLKEKDGWNKIVTTITDFSKKVHCSNSFLNSNFREYLNYDELNQILGNYAIANWWHQFQHGIAILGHSAIIAYLRKSKNIFIASTYSDEEAKFFNKAFIPCASSPNIDNEFKFAGCEVIHDGYTFKRLDKIKKVISFSKENNINIILRVCWVSTHGDNCSICDKCSRSIMSLFSLNEDPKDYGFNINDNTLTNIRNNLVNWTKNSLVLFDWITIQNNFKMNEEYWRKQDDFKWFLDYKF